MLRAVRPSSGSRVRSRTRENRRRSRASGWRRVRELIVDSLREHPIFDLNDAPESDARPGVVEAAELSETQRQPLYKEQWLRIFLVRLRLSAIIGITSFSVFVGFYFFIFPALDRRVFWLNAILIAVMVAQIALTFRLGSLRQARLLTLGGFTIFSLLTAAGLSLVTAQLAAPHLESARAVQFVIIVSYAHILITLLVLPLRLGDTLALSAAVLLALRLGLRSNPAPPHSVPAVAALWAISTFALFVTLLSHFNSRLRRRVFDSAFDLALQASAMKAISETDALTGGFNRRHSERALANELVRSARFSRPLSLLMFDLDNFKPVNDNLGHSAGDLVLIAVYQAASAELREVDDLARIGGDEFLILLPETDQKQAQRIARRLHARVTRELEVRFGHQSLLSKVTISVGALTLQPGHGLEAKAVLERVDELLYDAKNAGKNRVVLGVAAGEF